MLPRTKAHGRRVACVMACRATSHAHPVHTPRPHPPHPPTHQILMLNGAVDRETGQCLRRPGAMAASDVLLALTDALNRRGGRRDPGLDHPPSAYCTAVLAPRGGGVEVDADALAALGVRVVRSVSAEWSAEAGAAHYDPDALVAAVRDLLA